MELLTILQMLNYGLVLIFGLALSVYLAGGCARNRQKFVFYALCLLLLLVQAACYFVWGVDVAERLYPLIIHLPLTLALIFALKKSAGVALVSVFTAYLCCQLPRWVSLVAAALSSSALVGELCYTACIVPAFLLLRRYFAPAAHDAMTYSKQTLALFGSLPFAYYLFDYATTVYNDVLLVEVQALYEFLPTVLIAFYVLFLTLYHAQSQKKAQAEFQAAMLEKELKKSHTEIEQLNKAQGQTAVYQHDMRHHLNMIDGLLSADKPQQAAEYIRKVQADVEAITLKRFCENETVNLLCSSFCEKAERMGVDLTVKAQLPKVLPVHDTELCSVVSNGLENALHAAASLEEPLKWVRFYCEIKNNTLLLEIKNPFVGAVPMKDGLPVSPRENHGYGCRSILAITQRNRGQVLFEPKNGVFTLRAALPVPQKNT